MKARLKDTLLLVGANAADRAMLREIFEEGYNLLEAESSTQAEVLIRQNANCIAVVLADVPVSKKKELSCMSEACCVGTENEIPLLLLIEPSEKGDAEEQAFSFGVTDVAYKPYAVTAMRRRVQNIVDLFRHKWHLESLVREQSETIRKTNLAMVDALSTIIEHRSTESGNHILRIRRFTQILLNDVAQNCPEYSLTEDVIDIIANASALHDIGKISIPDAVLNKPGRLTPEEFETIKTHTTVGSQLVEQLGGIGDTEYLRYAYNIALYHHERWDGNGYPLGLAGNEIPICAQVVGLADVFDALTTPRVYKPALPCEKAINMILNGECGTFSPKLLECFKHVRTQMVALAERYADGYSPKLDTISVPLPGPVWKAGNLDTLGLSQVKYQTLLHYIDATVLELEPNNDLCHLIYNPDPDLEILFPATSFRALLGRLNRSGSIHPEDYAVADEISRFVREGIYHFNLRRKSFYFRYYSQTLGEYQPYELSFLQVHTGAAEQNIVLAIFRRVEKWLAAQPAAVRSTLHSANAFYGLVSSAIRCRSDRDFTIDGGARDLFSLTGYDETEIFKFFNNSFLNMIVEEDRPLFRTAMENLIKTGGIGECEFRLLRKEAAPVWVLIKGRLYVEVDGQEYFYIAVRDNSRSKTIQQSLQNTADRNRTIIEQADGIIFKWDFATDMMHCSHKWEEHFGYPPVSKNYSAQMGIATHFHPDDLTSIREYIEKLRSGQPTVALDVRIATGDGRYLWYKITGTMQRDESGKPARIIGMLQNIDELKRAAIMLREQAERDALTKLFNKASSQRLISEYLLEREAGAMAALLVLDLDNFKGVNDTYGHLYGDAMLAQIGSTLRRLFRSNDVIGRIGGDEFVILLRDIPDEQILYNRCELLLDTFRELFGRIAPSLPVSLSIGAAFAPTHGTAYADLFRHADEALYQAKNEGKNTYCVYDPQEQFDLLRGNGRANTRIDSDELPGIANDSFARFVFRRLYESGDFVTAINEILAYIGRQFNVSRVYIFENDDTNEHCSNTFEWCNKGIVPQIHELQNISYEEDIKGWREAFDERGILYCQDISTLEPHIRAIVEPQGIKSMLHCAILDDGVFRGYVGFDECTQTRMWTQDQVNLLEFLAQMLALFLIKERTRRDAVTQMMNMQNMLDAQDAWIYVIDSESCEIKFLNKSLRSIAPESGVGEKCYKVIMGRSERCENCPAFNLSEGERRKAAIENPKIGRQMRVYASHIHWNGQDACLLADDRWQSK